MRMTAAEARVFFGNTGGNQIVNQGKKAKQIQLASTKKMTKPEIEYGHILRSEFPSCEVKYEPFTLRLKSSNKYTPDWVVLFSGLVVLVVETKGHFRLGSAARSAAVFKEAIAEYPAWLFRHVRRNKNGTWDVAVANNPPSMFRPMTK